MSDVSMVENSVLARAKERYRIALGWEADARAGFLRDTLFANADADNGDQWPEGLRLDRENREKPCLTMNMVQVHNRIILNEMLKNKTSMRVVPVGGEATQEAALVYNQLIRRIEYQSKASLVYGTAKKHLVNGGIGYWRLQTGYLPAGDDWEQEIYLLAIEDPLAVLMDPAAKLSTGGDANWAFVFDKMPEDMFRNHYPKWAHLVGTSGMGSWDPLDGWTSDRRMVHVCEYWERVSQDVELLNFVHPETGKRVKTRADALPEEIARRVRAHEHTKTRTKQEHKVNWRLFVGDNIVDETDWAGHYIPIVRVEGIKTVINGKMDRKGHTRWMKDAQRMYNYNASGQVEFGALQSKVPWLVAIKGVERYEQVWKSANTEDHAYLPYDHIDPEDGVTPIPPPNRPQPPVSSQLFAEGMNTAMNQIQLTSGQFGNSLGQPGQERTGAAIDSRKDQGDLATYHFADSFHEAQAWSCELIMDLLPHIYDTKRVLAVQADDGSSLDIEIDPAARSAYVQMMGHDREVAKRILNPRMGRYAIEATVGDAGTSREQTVQALTLILTQAPGLTGIIGDLLLSAMQFKEAQEAAQRLRRMVPPQAMGQGPSAAEQQLQQQLAGSQAQLQKVLDNHAKDRLKLVGKDQMRDIDVYNAETARLGQIAKLIQADPGAASQALTQLMADMQGARLDPVVDANAEDLGDQGGDQAPTADPGGIGMAHPGARAAPDGNWYMDDPSRRGRYLKIESLAHQGSPTGPS